MIDKTKRTRPSNGRIGIASDWQQRSTNTKLREWRREVIEKQACKKKRNVVQNKNGENRKPPDNEKQ